MWASGLGNPNSVPVLPQEAGREGFDSGLRSDTQRHRDENLTLSGGETLGGKGWEGEDGGKLSAEGGKGGKMTDETAAFTLLTDSSSSKEYESEVRHFLADPQVDLVIMWMNSSDMTWRKELGRGPNSSPLYNPNRTDLCHAFTQLKYSLRSIDYRKLMRYVRKVFIVFSDLHPPPCFLNENHPQLHFVRHSDMWLDAAKSSLPNFNRNAIEANLHRIPDLGDWYMVLHKDFYLTSEFKWSDFVQCGGIETHLGGNTAQHRDQEHTAQLLEKQFGPRKRSGFLHRHHVPWLVWRPSIEEMERIWPEEYNSTAFSKTQSGSDIFTYGLHQNFMLETGRARPATMTTMGQFAELHTNSKSYCPRPCDGYIHDVSDVGFANVKAWLSEASLGVWRWVNIQGPGFDDSYRFDESNEAREYSPRIAVIASEWFEDMYSMPSRFELRNTVAAEVPWRSNFAPPGPFAPSADTRSDYRCYNPPHALYYSLDGLPAVCGTKRMASSTVRLCCSAYGWCGVTDKHCPHPGIDYEKQPEHLDVAYRKAWNRTTSEGFRIRVATWGCVMGISIMSLMMGLQM